MLFILTIIFLLIFFLAASYKKTKLTLSSIVIIAIMIRLFFVFTFRDSASDDMYTTLSAGSMMLEKRQHYEILYFPFFPILGLFALVLQHYIHPFLTLKFIYLLFEILVVVILYLIDKKNNTAFLFALNPVTIISGLVHGQFDIVPIFFLLTSVYFLLKHRERTSMLSFSAAVFTKTWPIAFVFPFVRNLRKKKWLMLIPLVPLISVFLYSLYSDVSVLKILYPVKNYHGLFGDWGWSQVLNLLVPHLPLFVSDILRRFFIVIFLMFSIFYREKKLIREISVLMLFFFSFTPTFGIQWLTWVIPFVLLTKTTYWRGLMIIMTIYFMLTFFGDIYPWIKKYDMVSMAVMYIGFGVWLTILSMFLTRVRETSPWRKLVGAS